MAYGVSIVPNFTIYTRMGYSSNRVFKNLTEFFENRGYVKNNHLFITDTKSIVEVVQDVHELSNMYEWMVQNPNTSAKIYSISDEWNVDTFISKNAKY